VQINDMKCVCVSAHPSGGSGGLGKWPLIPCAMSGMHDKLVCAFKLIHLTYMCSSIQEQGKRLCSTAAYL